MTPGSLKLGDCDQYLCMFVFSRKSGNNNVCNWQAIYIYLAKDVSAFTSGNASKVGEREGE